jgi:hypothetical protein
MPQIVEMVQAAPKAGQDPERTQSFRGLRLKFTVEQFGRAALQRRAGAADGVGQITVLDRIAIVPRNPPWRAAGSAP